MNTANNTTAPSSFASETHLTNFSDDAYGRAAMAKKLVDNVLNKLAAPNTFGIYDSWGTGKTSFISFMEKHIAEDSTLNNQIHVVHFDPWKYEQAGNVDMLFALLKTIDSSFNKCLVKKDFKQTDSNVTPLLTAALAIGGSLAVKGLSAITNGAVDIDDMSSRYSEASTYINGEIATQYRKWVDTFDEINILFDSLVGQGLANVNKQKIFVFIDDLDRCLPDNTVKLLESLKNFLNQKNTIFVIAIDNAVVSEMIEHRYGLGNGYGREYMEKIVNLKYYLPRPNINQTVNAIFRAHNQAVDALAKENITKFLTTFAPEPRRSKQLLNQFVVALLMLDDSSTYVTDHRESFSLFVAIYLKSRYSRYFSADRSNNKAIYNMVKSDGGTANINKAIELINAKDIAALKSVFNFTQKTSSGGSSATVSIDRILCALELL